MSSSRDILRHNAAVALDLTHDLDRRGPKTYLARCFLAAWLDTGQGPAWQVRRDTSWLRTIAAGSPRGIVAE